jgi:2-polyprenyl-3-methyl-5-hydroxy-6-metoxy-1,4-benzoquinol methylase
MKSGSAAHCPICGSGAREWKPADVRQLVPGDLAITDDRYGTTLRLLDCDGCSFRFADPAALPELSELYRSLDDPAYEDGAEPRLAQQRELLRRVLRAAPGTKSVLDVGTATGLLLAAAAEAGLEAVGVEPSESLAAAGRRSGRDVRTGALADADLGDQRFDLVTLVDVLEHVIDPVALLESAVRRLAPGGRLLVVTPDVSSVAARLLRRRWWHLRLAHVGYFDRRTLSAALSAAGVRPERWWRPGWVFEVGYLVRRIGRYVPPLRKLRLPGALAARAVRVNPRDSWAVLAS